MVKIKLGEESWNIPIENTLCTESKQRLPRVVHVELMFLKFKLEIKYFF